ncbi:MAG: hypothetical protein M3P50_07820 [Actinomycetota bacterium]|nr:hypothetical protein [Actinomycetota bacterium]
MPSFSRALLGAFFLGAGALHFIRPEMYEAIMPGWVPAHREMVYASGVAEAAGGAAVLAERTGRPGGWLLIATLVGVFPANVHMALNPDRYSNIPEPLLWARLPLQALMIAWVYRVAIRPR